jgi:hypothetical protein
MTNDLSNSSIEANDEKNIENPEYKKAEQEVENIKPMKERSMNLKVQGNKGSGMSDEAISNTAKAAPENTSNIQSLNDSTNTDSAPEELNDIELSKDSVNMEATAEFKSLRSGVPANIGVDIGDSEEKIIDIYENAKKEGDKYIVISEEREITFIVKEGKVTEIILR